eukprot:gnl/TRDRNA2_/TRDRNA2_177080_c1_seq6.p2 gnl/TRDRNA2_/TRDRNA2_177080_c1~~gnl/TRDRNA2_/TRDRNA2_177080_c1_seq6.p2  ORF type:complete len:139 (+),score=33.34 gnl/TRDRNA2_/TRDRNA2_177080_c1_seq6:83-499(+)
MKSTQLRALIFAALVLAAAGGRIKMRRNITTKRARLTLDINQKVYVDNSPVLGDGAGEGALDTCQDFTGTTAKVCGTNIKATFYLMSDCNAYCDAGGSCHEKTLGSCNDGLDADTCESWSTADDERFEHYQSYLIEPC